MDNDDLGTVKRMMLTEEEIRAKHPTEYYFANKRKELDYLSNMHPNEVFIFNLPKSATVD